MKGLQLAKAQSNTLMFERHEQLKLLLYVTWVIKTNKTNDVLWRKTELERYGTFVWSLGQLASVVDENPCILIICIYTSEKLNFAAREKYTYNIHIHLKKQFITFWHNWVGGTQHHEFTLCNMHAHREQEWLPTSHYYITPDFRQIMITRVSETTI